MRQQNIQDEMSKTTYDLQSTLQLLKQEQSVLNETAKANKIAQLQMMQAQSVTQGSGNYQPLRASHSKTAIG